MVWVTSLSLCRSHAIACVNQFIINQPLALVMNIVPFIEVSEGAMYYAPHNIPHWVRLHP